MGYQIIESYDFETTVQIGERSYPSLCLVEDIDGIRILIISGNTYIPARVWLSAYTAGAQAILRVRPTLSYVLTTTFLEEKYEDKSVQGVPGFFIADFHWRLCDGPLSYVQMVTSEPSVIESMGFVHLHTHSEHSALDGYSTIDEILDAALADNQKAVAITDHGLCSGHPVLQLAARKRDIKPIFGMEAYFVNDRHRREGKSNDYHHLILWAMNDDGLHNLWAMSTESYREGFYYKPRLDWDTLERLNEGVMASTACLGGPLLGPWLEGDLARAEANLGRLRSIFDDRLYLELHANQLPEQIRGNRWLVEVAQRHSLPLIAVADSHYAVKEDRDAHRTWLSVQTDKDIQDDTTLFAGAQDYHMLTEVEMRASLSYLPPEIVDEAVLNTGRVAARCTAQMKGKDHNPIYSRPTPEHPDPRQHDIDRLLDICLERWNERTVGKPVSQQAYMDRFEHEMPLIIQKEYPGYFLMTWDFVDHAKKHGVLVGPSRGSGGGSLVAYLCGITEIDPVENDLLFERFMTEGRVALPDFDIDFPSSKKQFMLDYAAQRWNPDNVAIVGTHLRLKNKGAINDTSRAMKSVLPDTVFMHLKEVSAIIDQAEASTAGLGLSWEELWAEHGEVLEKYRELYPELFAMAARLRGRLKTYSKHAAGIIIDPEETLTGALPLWCNSDSTYMVTQFDKDVLEELGYVKFDMLNIANLDTVQIAVDLIHEKTGQRVNPYVWREEYDDPYIWDEIGEGWTLGIFQIGTTAGTRLTKRFKPRSLAELADVITLVRPGPTRSGLTETYFRRRNGDEEITFADSRLETLLAKTYGTMLYQEDIMATCMTLAAYGSDEADGVRKILGKKKVELVADAGRKFVRRAVENKTEREVAELLWEQMAEFAKYCVSGDTRVHLAAAGPSSDGVVTIERLYDLISAPLEDSRNGRPYPGKFPGPCNCCGKEAPKYIRGRCNACYVWFQKFRDVNRGVFGLTLNADGRIRPARILMVHKHAAAETFMITLSDGRSITATANHRHLTPQGLRRVDELSIGDSLVVDMGCERHHYVAEEQRVTSGARRREGAVNGAFGEENYGYIDGGFTSLMAWTAMASDYCEECGHDGSQYRLERAHLDGDRTHNESNNLRMLCVSCHKKHDYKFNGRRRRFEKGHLSAPSEIVSIEFAGVQPVYSLVMDDPHLWVANGIVTSNSFNRAHAFAYAIVGFWTAWLKFHYPIQFLCAALSTVKQDRIPDFVQEARRMGYHVLPPDINESNKGFTATQMAVRYGLTSVSGVGDAAALSIMEGRPYVSWEDFLKRKGPKCNSGHVKTLVRIGAFDSLVENRRGLELLMEEAELPGAQRCIHRAEMNPETNLPCIYDWAQEPPVVGRSGRPLKAKPLPKKCTQACRRFELRAPLDPLTVRPYTDEDIRQIEMESLGVFLSSTPFDRIPEEDRAQISTAVDVLTGPSGEYLIAGLIRSCRKSVDRYQRKMAFMTFTTERGDLEVTVFNKEYERYHQDFKVGTLSYATIRKNSRGQTLDLFISLDAA